MVAKGKISSLKHVDVGVCEHCIFGKKRKVSFSKAGKTPKVEKLELVHTDVWGPVILSIVVVENLHMEQLDVKTAFLHGDLEEDIYMTQTEGFEMPGKENLVCKLHKSLYGLKQAPMQWYKKFNEFMSNSGFNRCDMDHCCYVKKYTNSYVILVVYVDVNCRI